jgi:hypothetical protein
MEIQASNEALVHSYDTEQRAIRCGVRGQGRSTKHRAGVTCPSCRRLLLEAAPAKEPEPR